MESFDEELTLAECGISNPLDYDMCWYLWRDGEIREGRYVGEARRLPHIVGDLRRLALIITEWNTVIAIAEERFFWNYRVAIEMQPPILEQDAQDWEEPYIAEDAEDGKYFTLRRSM